MKDKPILVFSLLVAFLSVGLVTKCFATGFDNHTIGTKGAAMAHAFEGISDDASAVFYNPAGLALLGKDAGHWEAYGFIGDATCEYEANSIKDESQEPFYIPGFFLSKTYDDWGFGLGLYIPLAGGGTSYDNFQGSGHDLEAFAGWYSLTFSTGYKIREDLAIGIGFSVYSGMLEMKSFDSTLNSEIKSEYDGYSGYGAHIGVMYKPTRELSIGLVARSPIDMQMDGTVRMAGIKFDSEAEFKLPVSYTLGLGYQLHENLTIGLTFWYRLYSNTKELAFETLNVETEMKTYFENDLLVAIGADYKINDKLSVQAGVNYDESATKDKGLNPGFCELPLLTPVIGMGYRITQSTELFSNIKYVMGMDEEYNEQNFEKKARHFMVGARFRY